MVQHSARSDQPYKSFKNRLTFQNFVRGQIFGPLVLLDEEAESLRYFFGAKPHASTLREKYERCSPRPLKCCIKKVTNFVTELPEIPNDLPGESELLACDSPSTFEIDAVQFRWIQHRTLVDLTHGLQDSPTFSKTPDRGG